jgi:hypothetical protein
VQDRCMVCAEVPQPQKSFWMHPMVLLGERLKWKLVSIRLEIVLILTQDRCTICVERTTGSKIILDAHDGTARCVGHVESYFIPVRLETVLVLVHDRCTGCAERTIG